ncbi:nucleoside hydrolase [Granulicella arctica]|uniref:nucleoside hydrolase n=1 Tax=Granulicella arctica TaxID=940613 RepID=UPI0021E03B60|nr:nucleoside hydrolase [Granulicella arctica]
MLRRTISYGLPIALLLSTLTGVAQAPAKTAAKVIIDTDIGDDIDDVFAVDLAMVSPELKILGLSGAWGDTALRGQMLDRLVCETGRTDIAVNVGPSTKPGTTFTQAPWARQGIARSHGDAVTFLLDQIRQAPGEITLLALAPLTTIGAAIDRDPASFRKLKRVVMMGGSVYRGYGDLGYTKPHGPDAEYNIAMDPAAAQKLFRSGVPIYMMPLDATQLKFDEVKRALLATVSTPMTDTLQVLTAEWQRSTGQATPTMFDAVAVAYAVDPAACPTTPLHIEVDGKGFTRVTPGDVNAQVCLEPKEDTFFKMLLPRLLEQRFGSGQSCTQSLLK